ncbi:MAG: hypothetical protein HN345_11205 [Planctomycetaceae bacterium]|nr:hypothetical protein [Planctomycetaceae bacterium]
MDDVRDHEKESLRTALLRRWRWFSRFLKVLFVGFVIYQAPRLTVFRVVRDWPLQRVFEGLAGQISSSSAEWDWFGPIIYRDFLIRTSDGVPLLAVDRVEINRSPLALAFKPNDVGRIRIEGGRLSTAVWNGGSTIETVLEPWIAKIHQRNLGAHLQDLVDEGNQENAAKDTQSRITGTIELVNSTIELTDLRQGDAWLLSELSAVMPFPVLTEGGVFSFQSSDVICSGSVQYAEEPQLNVMQSSSQSENSFPTKSIMSRANSMLARPGGWSVTVSEQEPDHGKYALVIGATRCPAGISRMASNRFGWSHVLQGVVDIRADLLLSKSFQIERLTRSRGETAQYTIKGNVVGRDLSVVDTVTEEKQFLIEKIDVPFEADIFQEKYVIQKFQAETNLGYLEATGTIRAPSIRSFGSNIALPGWHFLEAVQADNFEAQASLDIPSVLNAFPGIHLLRPDVQLTEGKVDIVIKSQEKESSRQVYFKSELDHVSAMRGEEKVEWNTPWSAWVYARQPFGGELRLEEAGLSSAFADISMNGLADTIETTWRIDLGRIFQKVNTLVDFQSDGEEQSLEGISRGQCRVDKFPERGSTKVTTSLSVENLCWTIGNRVIWKDHLVAADFDTSWVETPAAISLETAGLKVESGSDSLVVALANECRIARDWKKALWLNRPTPGEDEHASFDCHMSGNLVTWQQRILGLGTAVGFQPRWSKLPVAGNFESSWTLGCVGQQFQITKATGHIEQFSLHSGKHHIEEPRVVIAAVGSINPTRGIIKLSSAEVLSSTVSLRTNGLQLSSKSSTTQPLIDSIFDSVQGQLQWQVDLTRLDKWLAEGMTSEAAGRLWGTVDLLETPSGINLLMTTTGSQLALSPASTKTSATANATSSPVWIEPQVNGLLDVTRPVVNQVGLDQLKINRLKIESSTMSVVATGSMRDLSGQREVELGGTILTNWQQLVRLLSPSSGTMLKLTGGGPQPFTVRGSFGPVQGKSAAGDSVTLPLPDQWRSPTQESNLPRQQYIALPLQQQQQGIHEGLAKWLPQIRAETTLSWQSGQIADFPLGPGTLPIQLVEGQLAFGPFAIPVSGGTVRGSPWIQLFPPPGEVVLPPGRLVERVALTPPLCDQWLSWLSPIMRSSTEAQGFLTVDTSGGQLPLSSPLNGRFDGQLWLEQFSVTPGDMAGPLIKLLAKLQSVVDPRFAFGDQVVFLRARPDPVHIWISEGRVHHDNLILDMGQLSVQSKGSMGQDGSLSMQIEVAFRGDVAGATPVVAQLLRTPFVIPLRGTVQRPQFDATALDTILTRIMQNTADAVLRDGIGRGLEALFGNPQPPENASPQSTQPLTFPDTD